MKAIMLSRAKVPGSLFQPADPGRAARRAVGERFDIRRNTPEFAEICPRVIAAAEVAEVEGFRFLRGRCGDPVRGDALFPLRTLGGHLSTR